MSTKRRDVPFSHLATPLVKACVDGKVNKLRVNQHAFHSFSVRNHAGMGPLGHFIIATAPALQQNNKEIFVAG